MLNNRILWLALTTLAVLTAVNACHMSQARLNALPVVSAPADSLDPNECSRGIDESNQGSCDLGGAQ